MDRDENIQSILGKMNLDDLQKEHVEATLRRMSDFEFDRQIIILKRCYVEDIGA